ncbi:hypothetical protein A3841_17950 [Pontibacter flavimaris]|uniref:Uncharacterized protein n=1 Tax=Pontibacter flavimaris TaxID=1797110 RepID=A0A1Q5PDG9_9BACT|nr:hypothetical protein A3841_17950 [Pontibacter flavimaris]
MQATYPTYTARYKISAEVCKICLNQELQDRVNWQDLYFAVPVQPPLPLSRNKFGIQDLTKEGNL